MVKLSRERVDRLARELVDAMSRSRAVMFLKDHMTLLVDAHAMNGIIGPQRHTATDLAYTLATAVLACWSEG